MTFTEKLEHLMDKKGIKNRSQLSKQSGIPYTTIVGFFEKGTENIRRTTLIKLSDFFNCSLEYLVSDEIEDEDYGKNQGFKINSSEIQHIKKYRTLDEHGKKMVDFTLNEEYERCTVVVQEQPETKYINLKIAQLPASAGTGVELSDENYEILPVKYSELTEQADFAVTVSGDSMQPTYYDGDILLVENIPAQIGDIGVFVVDGDGYVKEYGGDRLISHNEEYPDIMLKDHDYVMCSGKVIGVLEDSDIE